MRVKAQLRRVVPAHRGYWDTRRRLSRYVCSYVTSEGKVNGRAAPPFRSNNLQAARNLPSTRPALSSFPRGFISTTSSKHGRGIPAQRRRATPRSSISHRAIRTSSSRPPRVGSPTYSFIIRTLATTQTTQQEPDAFSTLLYIPRPTPLVLETSSSSFPPPRHLPLLYIRLN